jgi:hypothetical protein
MTRSLSRTLAPVLWALLEDSPTISQPLLEPTVLLGFNLQPALTSALLLLTSSLQE